LKQVEIFQVDAFTDRPFGGNPAGVVPRAEGLTAAEMQLIAREIKASETAFVLPPSDDRADVQVRFFTPTREVALCGHATIATFHLLAELGRLELKPGLNLFRQETNAGVLPVEVHVEEAAGRPRIMMHQVLPKIVATIDNEESVADLLGTEALNIKDAPGKVQIVSTGLPDLIVPVRDRESLYGLRPDFEELAAYCRRHQVVSVHAFCFAPEEDEFTVYCRDFAPAAGIPEEAATGTANGALGAYLVLNRLIPVDGDAVHIVAGQGHNLQRPSSIAVEIQLDGETITAVKVGGTAVTVLRGELSF